ncbi:MAG: peptide ABC transporter substrate-binding protein, partial [Chlamydiia bacterium]|nr:peptide ABC transporter substrate-binding protein [Chlamydiia bacterium]
TISENKKTYTFRLRDTFWNNGDPVTAHDFLYSWSQQLSPQFKTSFLYIFHPIKNAQKIHKGILSPKHLGVSAKDDKTLVVQLESPCPYFLDYLTLNAYFPVHAKIDQKYPDWPLANQMEFPCNGPFMVARNIPHVHLQLKKNLNYWDRSRVRLDQIDLHLSNKRTALQSFKKGTNDWIGYPFSLLDELLDDTIEKKSATSFWNHQNLAVNTENKFLHSAKIRRALSLALNRTGLFGEHQPNVHPTTSPLPKAYSQMAKVHLEGNPSLAKELFREGLDELGIKAKDFPELTILQAFEFKLQRGHFLPRIQQQLNDVLGIKTRLKSIPTKYYFKKKMLENDAHLILLSWSNYVDTPFYFFDSFIFNPPCGSSWLTQPFQEALARAKIEEDSNLQWQKLKEVEELFCDLMPIIPICYRETKILYNERLKGLPTNLNLGLWDLKEAYFKSERQDPKSMIEWIAE